MLPVKLRNASNLDLSIALVAHQTPRFFFRPVQAIARRRIDRGATFRTIFFRSAPCRGHRLLPARDWSERFAFSCSSHGFLRNVRDKKENVSNNWAKHESECETIPSPSAGMFLPS